MPLESLRYIEDGGANCLSSKFIQRRFPSKVMSEGVRESTEDLKAPVRRLILEE